MLLITALSVDAVGTEDSNNCRGTTSDLAPWDAPDGQINAAEVLIATQLTMGIRTPGALQYAHGDMNLDDVIDLADLLLIQQAVLQ